MSAPEPHSLSTLHSIYQHWSSFLAGRQSDCWERGYSIWSGLRPWKANFAGHGAANCINDDTLLHPNPNALSVPYGILRWTSCRSHTKKTSYAYRLMLVSFTKVLFTKVLFKNSSLFFVVLQQYLSCAVTHSSE